MHNRIKEIISKIGKFYKRRFMNTKGKRIYIQDTELTETLFQPKSKIECEFSQETDLNGSELKVFLTREGKMSVSKRKRANHVNPVIDIRRQAVLEKFSKYKYVEVEIYGDEVIVRGFDDIKESHSVSDIIDSKKDSKSKIVDITKRLELKKEVRYSREFVLNKLLAKASGDNSLGHEQISFDSMWENYAEISQSISSTTDSTTRNRLSEDLSIALNMVSLCSGAGVLDKGFIDQGFKGILAMDIEKDMVETYKANLGDHAVAADLSNYDMSTIPDAKALVAGSPCQDFVRP